jgi:hypothetical protein
MEDMEDYSDDDFQCVEDLDYDINDDFCVTDLETQKIDMLTENMYNIKKQLYTIDDNKLNNLDNIKRDFYFLCENNRYLIDDSTLLQELEICIYENITIHENKLSKIYEELVDKEDELIEKEIKEKAKEKAKLDYNKLQEEIYKNSLTQLLNCGSKSCDYSQSFYKNHRRISEPNRRDNSQFKNIIELRELRNIKENISDKLSDSK